MRAWFAVASVLVLLVGCTDRSAPAPVTPLPPAETVPRATVHEAIAHMEGHGALRISVRAERTTTCTILWAAYGHTHQADILEPAFEWTHEGKIVHHAGSSRSVGTTRVNVLGVDTSNTTMPIFESLLGAVGQVGGQPNDPHTYAQQLFDAKLPKGVNNFTAYFEELVDHGADQAKGGSLRIQVKCNRDVVLLGDFQDRNPLVQSMETAQGDVDVQVDPFLVDYHHGALQYVTENGSLEFEAMALDGMGTIQLSGPANGTFSWAPDDSVILLKSPEFTFFGPPGAYRVEWQQAGVVSDLMFFMYSWEPLHPLSATPL